MRKSIEEIEFSIFDTETTGLEPRSGDRIVEIAAIRFKGRTHIGSFQSLVDPQRPISAGAYQVNHIGQEELKNAPLMSDIAPLFFDFIKGSCLCSYNAPFDLEFLKQELMLCGREWPDQAVVDILTMARRLLPRLSRYSLWFVAETLGIKKTQSHRALADVEMTLEVFYRLKDILASKTAVDFDSFVRLFGVGSRMLQDLHAQRIAEIQEAINLGVTLKITYFSNVNAEVTQREVIPKEIRQEKSRTYLVGYCCLRRQERTFRTDGILHLEII
jgi:DNA polymerase-3 subunit epsilon